ncbi:conserved hypothetical protein [Marinobacter salarius]|nr:conserved hypothetical protein [Marinobacter salarius]
MMCLLLLLTACKPALVQTKTEYRYPPAYLLEPCPIPAPALTMKNIDLADYASELQTMLRICNTDKTELRKWSAESSETDTQKAERK